MKLSLIVAASRNGVIGREGQLPWRLSADLQRFKRLTMGHPIIMGRKTYESIGRPLPGRTSICITRQNHFLAPGIRIAGSIEEALEVAAAAEDDEAFVIGGAEIYRQLLPAADRIYLTTVAVELAGDTLFPELDRNQWKVVEQTSGSADAKNEYAHTFEILERS